MGRSDGGDRRRSGPDVAEAPEEGARLVAAWRRGEPKAFNALFSTYRSLVYGLLSRLLPHDPELDDVVQNAFVEVFRSLHRFEGRARLSSWIARIALRSGYRHLRRRRTRPADFGAGHPLPDLVDASVRGDPAAAPERREAEARVYAILGRLPEKKRTVFILHDLEGFPQEEVAAIVECRIQTVRSRLFYARQAFWAEVEKDPVLRVLGGADAKPAGFGGAQSASAGGAQSARARTPGKGTR